jgi:hypothetical protein
MPLDSQRDSSWPLGEWANGATEEEPGGSAQTITGLLGDDSKPYRRGGSTYKSNAAVGTGGVLWVWDGRLGGGRRTVLSSSTPTIYDLGVDDATPAAIATLSNIPANPIRAVGVAGIVSVPRTTGDIYWAGSRLAEGASYTTGTVTVTEGSRAVTGSGTSWLANGDAGSLLTVAGLDQAVASIDTNTTLTLALPWVGSTASGASYVLGQRVLTTGPGDPGQTIRAAVANRLLVASGQRVAFSRVGLPTVGTSTDYHQFDGQVLGMGSLGDSALVFTEVGAYAVENMGVDLTDAAGNPQQRRDLINADLIVWTHEGIAPFRGSLVVPALDGVWLMDATSAPVRISDRVADLYLSYVRAGYKTGVAEVFNAHYFLPILDGSNAWVDTLVCRLQPTLSGGQYAWSQLAGSGATVRAYAERSSSPPKLLGASTLAASRVIDCTSYFQPSASVKNDADGTTHTWRLTTRNIAIGDRPTGVVYVRAWYALVDAASDNPTITAEASVDGAAYQTLAVTTGTDGGTTAGEQDGSQAVYWAVGLAGRFIRFRFTCTNPAASLQFKQLEFFYRSRGN